MPDGSTVQDRLEVPSLGNGNTTWEYEQKISAPLNGLVSTDQDLSLGDLQTNQVGIIVKQ